MLILCDLQNKSNIKLALNHDSIVLDAVGFSNKSKGKHIISKVLRQISSRGAAEAQHPTHE